MLFQIYQVLVQFGLDSQQHLLLEAVVGALVVGNEVGIFLPEGLGQQHIFVLFLLRGALLAVGGLFLILHLFLLGGREGLIGGDVFGIEVDVFAGLVEVVGLVLGE